MRIHKNLIWLKSYILDAKHIIPRVRDIKLVKELFHQKGKIQRVEGSLTYDFLFGKYTLSLYGSYKKEVRIDPNLEMVIRPYSKIDILNTLAHELAHLKHWDHTPEHKLLESELTILFMERLLKSGYISEEEEQTKWAAKYSK